nr:DEAD/DEAH box helicase [uncultured Schaedlerella sp.]
MADLIININFDESRKKQGFVIEIYEGSIPHLKSKQFSGPLRNVNLTSVTEASNLSSLELNEIKKMFNDSANLQINKYQYLYSIQKIPFLHNLAEKGCLFYKERKMPMYQVENIIINSDLYSDGIIIDDFVYYAKKTTLYFNYQVQGRQEDEREIIPLFYIDIVHVQAKYPSDLYFDYGTDVVKFTQKDRVLDKCGDYRDYGFEQKIVNRLKQSHWTFVNREYFAYEGKDIANDLLDLEDSGIQLYTNNKKEIKVGRISNINISYDMDWFEINGEILISDEKVDLSKIIDFHKQKNDWNKINGQIIFLPDKLRKISAVSAQIEGNQLKVQKSELLNVLDIADTFDVKEIRNFKNLISYENIAMDLPCHIMDILREYQKIGVKWLLSLRKNGFGGCLADDMGLGKTLQIIAYLSDHSFDGTRSLIIVPKTLLENWKREFLKFSPKMKIYIYHGSNRNAELIQDYQITITTYGTLINDLDRLNLYYFENMIVDEAQYIKNSRSKAYRAVKSVQAQTKIIMTGTPIENNIQEYWDLMKITNSFGMRFKEISKGLEQDQIISKIRLVTSPFLLRRFKSDVLKDLPEKQEQTIYCDFDDSQRELYETMLDSIRHEMNRKSERFEIKSNSIVLSGLLYLQEICCHPRLIPKDYNINGCFDSAKLDVLMSMVSELHLSGHKIVIFSRFTKMLEIINKALIKQHMNVFYLDGKTRQRQEVVDDFEQSRDGVFLISLKAGGVGINLVSADTAIIYDPWWNPAVEKQAQDRIYRIGQKKKVTIYKLIVANTIEEKVQLLQDKKKELFEQVVSGHENPTNITMEDLKELIGNI